MVLRNSSKVEIGNAGYLQEAEILRQHIARVILVFALACGFFLPALVAPARAQLSTSGTITGTVTDATSAVVPQANVEIINERTGVRTTTQTNSDGSFVVPGLVLGNYAVAVVFDRQRPVQERPHLTSMQLQEGIALFERGSYRQAREVLERVVNEDPQSAEGFFYLGMAEFHLGRLEQAGQRLVGSLKLNPRSVNTLYNLGVLLREQKKAREAIPYLQKAVGLGGRFPSLFVNLAGAYLDDGQEERALRVADQARRRFDTPALNVALGKYFLIHGLLPPARESLERANRQLPGQPEIVLRLTEVYLRQRDLSSARRALEGVAARASDLAEFHYLSGQTYSLSGQKEPALREMDKALRIEPRNAMYLLTMGRFYQKYGEQREAVAVLEKAEQVAPADPEIPYSLAVSYFIADDFVGASRYVERALAIKPAFDRALFLLGLARFGEGKFPEAEAFLARAIELNPRNPYYYCFYGMLWVSENRLEDALPQLEKSLTLDPSYALAHYQLGKLLARKGRYDEASVELERAIQLDPTLTEAYYQLAHCYMRVGNQSKAAAATAAFQKLHKEEYSEREEVLRQMQQTVRGNN